MSQEYLFSIIQALASIGTFISAFIVILTLREMKEQRKSSTRPEIVVSRSHFGLYLPGGAQLNHMRWITGKPQKEYISDKAYHPDRTYLNAYNIGLAAAKNIIVSWQYEISEVIEKIERDPNYSGKISYTGNVLRLESSLSVINHTETFDYILPANIGDQYLSIKIPYDYILLCSELLILDLKSIETNDIFYFMSLPSLRLKISYTDITNNSYSKEFKVKLEFNSLINKNISSFEPVGSGEIIIEHIV